jgi:hypothetical protein
MNSKEIRGLLFKRYQPPAYAFFKEVSNGTGGQHTNYADAVVFGLYPSAGLEVEGFEIKTARGDWLNELKDMSKSSAVFQYCHRWWVVAPRGVVKMDEVPAAWGYYEFFNDKFYKKKAAPLLTPHELSRPFIASLLRRATEGVTPNEAIVSLERDAYNRGEKAGKESEQRERERLERRIEEVKKFEEASGINILEGWKDGREVGAAVNFVLDGGLRFHYSVDSAISSTKRVLADLHRLKNVTDAYEARKSIPPKS